MPRIFSLKGRGIGFSFSRFYNSLDPYQGPLGFGWTHNYNIHLWQEGSVAIVKYGDGREEFYVRQPDSSFTAQTGVFNTLVQEAAGSYTLTDKRLLVHHFDASGVLTAISDKNGNTMSLTYDSGRLVTVTDPGRSPGAVYL
ncbi:MAG: DUF6531 domain-containing protein [Deltaproteobacteria bacterium]|nr:DUF6531 domain-containing protein [Deltaproteobacteria bacterium]